VEEVEQKERKQENEEVSTHAIANDCRDHGRMCAEALVLLHVGRVQILRAMREEVEA
jgi:hypothetical protein